MSDTQDIVKTGGSELVQTGNPQTIGSPSQAAAQNNLQPGAGSVLNQPGLKISSVGSDTFKPVNISASTSVAPQSSPSSNSMLPIVIGLIIAAAILISLVILAIKKGER